MIRKNFKNANKVSSTIKHKTTEQYIKDYNKQEKKIIYEKKIDKQAQESSKYLSYVGSHSSNLFSSIIIILVGVAMVRLLYFGSADGVTFRSLLDLFANVPQVSTSVKSFVQQLQISGNWGIIDGLRTFINMNLQMSSIIIWLGSSLIDVCFFISYFLLWLFV